MCRIETEQNGNFHFWSEKRCNKTLQAIFSKYSLLNNVSFFEIQVGAQSCLILVNNRKTNYEIQNPRKLIMCEYVLDYINTTCIDKNLKPNLVL